MTLVGNIDDGRMAKRGGHPFRASRRWAETTAPKPRFGALMTATSRSALGVAAVAGAVAAGGMPFVASAQDSVCVDPLTGSAVGTTSGATNEVACGTGAVASGQRGVAIGEAAVASGVNGVALGAEAKASNASSTAIGVKSVASGLQATAVGAAAKASGDEATAVGVLAVASGLDSTALGAEASAEGERSLALGANSVASVVNATAVGTEAVASNASASAFGVGSVASGLQATAVGAEAKASGDEATAVGVLAVASGLDSVALGAEASAEGERSLALGANSVASVVNATAVGAEAVASNASATALGVQSVATGVQATAVGAAAKASGAGAVALGSLAQATHDHSVALGDGSVTGAVVNTASGSVGGQSYNFAGTDALSTVSVGSGAAVNGVRTVTNVAAGRILATSTDAVNGSQLFATNQAVNLNTDNIATIVDSLGGGAAVNPDGTVTGPTYLIGGNTYGNVGDALTNVDGRVTTIEANLANVGVGLVQQAAPGDDLTVGVATDGARVNFAGTAGDRVLTGVADGEVSATSIDAVNGSQLFATNQAIVDGLGGGATINPDGSIIGPTYVIDGNTYTDVGGALTDIDSRVIDNTTAITNLTNGTVGLVQQTDPDADLTVGRDTGGLNVNFAGTAGDRVLTGVAAGRVSSISNDAVNGAQLYGVAESISNALGGGSTVLADGRVTAPVYNIGGNTYNNVGDALTNVDGRVSTLEDNINGIANGTAGLVQQADDQAPITVGKDSGGKEVNFAGTDGDRRLTGVADGRIEAGSTDAINGGQLYDALGNLGEMQQDLADLASNAVTYDDASKSSLTLGKAGGAPVAIHNVADGRVEEGSTDAVNGGQLYAVQQEAHSYTDTQIASVRNELGGQLNTVNVRLDDLTRTVDRNHKAASAGIASVAAMANIPQAVNPGRLLVGGGVGYRDGQAAFALGLSGRLDNDRTTFKGSVGVDKSDVTLGLGIGHEF